MESQHFVEYIIAIVSVEDAKKIAIESYEETKKEIQQYANISCLILMYLKINNVTYFFEIFIVFLLNIMRMQNFQVNKFIIYYNFSKLFM